MAATHRISIICGAFPLVAGTAIFIGWIAVPVSHLEFAGLLLIILGGVLFAVGLGDIASDLMFARRTGRPPARHTAKALILLLANPPLCVLYVVIWGVVSNQVLVTVRNASADPIANLRLTVAREILQPIAPIPSGQTRVICASGNEGDVKYAFDIGVETRAGIIAGYVASGGRFELHLSKDRDVDIWADEASTTLADYLRHCI